MVWQKKGLFVWVPTFSLMTGAHRLVVLVRRWHQIQIASVVLTFLWPFTDFWLLPLPLPTLIRYSCSLSSKVFSNIWFLSALVIHHFILALSISVGALSVECTSRDLKASSGLWSRFKGCSYVFTLIWNSLGGGLSSFIPFQPFVYRGLYVPIYLHVSWNSLLSFFTGIWCLGKLMSLILIIHW